MDTDPWPGATLGLRTERLGPLPLINYFLARLDLDGILDRFVPTEDQRVHLPYAMGLGVLLRSILVERDPIYRQQETVSTYASEAFGLTPDLAAWVGDDAVGRSLDRLFDANRAALMTEVAVAASEEFDLVLDEVHNDSTTVRFTGQYEQARGRTLRGKRAPWITRGFSKDHRPDLKQLMFILTTTRDGGVPLQFRVEDGNASDSRTHEQSWEALRRLVGKPDFLYVADSKLCGGKAMDYLHERGGRFVTVMPRSRDEDREFREWIQTHQPDWEKVIDRRNPRRKRGPRDRWWVFRYPIPSKESWPVVWVYSELLALRQERSRRERIARAVQEFDTINCKLAGPRPRLKSKQEIRRRVDQVLGGLRVKRYLPVDVQPVEHHEYRQARPGRPGPNTPYRRKTKVRWQLAWQVDDDRIAYDRKSDGMYPLLTNDRKLKDSEVLLAHKGQPTIEKRFEQAKSVFEIAPVLLKNEGRVEAFFFMYFLALMVEAVIEREIRIAMTREGIQMLPIYPEQRQSKRPTAEQIFKLFHLLERHHLTVDGDIVNLFEPDLTELQKEVLRLLGVPSVVYTSNL